MNKGLLICITGIDGSGKTTLSKSIVKKYKEENIVFHYVHNRYDVFLMKPIFFIIRLTLLRGSDMFEDYHKDTHAKKGLLKNKIISILYELGIIIDYSLQSFFRISFPQFIFNTNIITDRHYYDTICTDLAIDLNYSNDKIKKKLHQYSKFFSHPNISFLIDIPEETAFKRKDDVPSIDYLKERKKIYSILDNECKFIKIDGSKNPADVCSMVIRKINEVIL